MKSFRCRVCDNPLYFENSRCVACGTSQGYSFDERLIVPVDANGRYVDAAGTAWYVCGNLGLSGCTWLAPDDGGQCASCDLTRTRPNDADAAGLAQLRVAEQAKRHLVAELAGLGFPIVGKLGPHGDEVDGLCFDLLSSVDEDVVIGHENGLITIDLAESDAAHREKVRDQLAEPYRTVLGHFRHEVGHYYQWQLVRSPEQRTRYQELFGDDAASYQDALDRHYAEGPPADWADSFISTYATMHPFEDFAETWAHFLHICDTVETAASYGITTVASIDSFADFRDVVTGVWIPLSIALNMINRSMGKDDLYPFVIPPPVLDKLGFIASLRPSTAR